MAKWMAGTVAVVVTVLAASPVGGQESDKKTIEKMLKDGAKKMTSAKAEEREEGAGYILGYITCDAQKDNVFEGGLINAIEQVTGKQPTRYKCP